MLNYIYFIPTLPLAGFLVLAMLGRHLSKKTATLVGVGSVAMSALLSVIMAIEFIGNPPTGHAFTSTLWTWMQIDGYALTVSFRLDALSLVMILIITVVGALIHLYASEYMRDDAGYSRFFAYMNLFVSSMLVLVLADNLPLLYLGWEGVGLCSYLLIGFWYTNPENGYAARKAFIVTRIGDTAMAIGMVLLFTELGTLDIQDLMQAAQVQWPIGHEKAVLGAFLLLCGALGKSAQIPFQVWLPDAMAGPTPVSALIHAATMVTAGVYLVARTHALFELAPSVQYGIAIIGAATLLLAGFSALVQTDIKRVLAYSTISQLGYMFLALGVGAWSAAVFHLMTHAFFKALLFLGAGAVIVAQHHEQNMLNMGGLRQKLPVVFWTFLIGAASLSSLPLVTAGFFSKDLILWKVWSSSGGGAGLWAIGLVGAFITSLYSFRMVFLIFFGDSKTAISHQPGKSMTAPLIILAVLSVIGGYVELPETLGRVTVFSGFLHAVLAEQFPQHATDSTESLLQHTAVIVSVSGVFIAYILFLRRKDYLENISSVPALESARKFLFAGWNFDALYDRLFIRPFSALVQLAKKDIIDSGYTVVADLNLAMSAALSRTQTGNIRWYAMAMAFGAVVFLGIVLLLN